MSHVTETTSDVDLVKRLSEFNGLHVSLTNGKILVASYQGVIFKGPIKETLIEVSMPVQTVSNGRKK